jgi:L-aspartate oxidase
MSLREIWCDVAVIGGGGAALRAALAAWQKGAMTVIVSKGAAARSGATYYSVAEVGAFNVPDGAKDPTDSPDVFFADMKAASLGMAALPLSRILADKAEEAMLELDAIGGGRVFARENGKFRVYKACFSSKARSHVVENHFKPIAAALGAEVFRAGIPVIEGYQAVDILTEAGETGGVLLVDRAGDLAVLHAKAVVLATGGASTLFKRNMYPLDITGDGYAMAFRAGADIANMEFIQSGIGVAHPFINLFGNYLWEANPQIRNAKGQEVIALHTPPDVLVAKVVQEKTHFPFSTRDDSKYIEIAVQSEINRGNATRNGNLFLEFLGSDLEQVSQRNPTFASMWKTTYAWHLAKGIDLRRQPVEIACFAHAINGGVLIDEKASSSLPGFFAAGETAAGPHGADRLGGNMSVTCQVFGKIAGEEAARRAKSVTAYPEVSKNVKIAQERIDALVSDRQADPDAILQRLQEASDRSLLIVRQEEGLRQYLGTLDELDAEIARGGPIQDRNRLIELNNLVLNGRLIANAALKRKESRGSHYRQDFPALDPQQEQMTVINIQAKKG